MHFPHNRSIVTIDQLASDNHHLNGAWEPLLPPLGPNGLEYPSESDLVVCRSSSPRARDSSLIDSASPGQNLHHHMEYGQFTSPFGTVDPRLRDFSDFELPSDEAILEAMTMVSILQGGLTPWFVFSSLLGDFPS
jgi:hypothetical protein